MSQETTLYRLVTVSPEGKMEDIETTDLSSYESTGIYENPRTRSELQGHPILKGFLGPFYDRTAIRYETATANNILSQ